MNLTEWIISVMEQLGYWGIACSCFLTMSFPDPSEIIMPSAGYSASQGELLLVGVIIAGSIGSLLAAALLYWIGYKFNHDSIFRFIDRYGKFLFIKSEDVKNLWNGSSSMDTGLYSLAGWFRSTFLISIPAGMSHMPFWKFMFYSGLGTVIWTTFLACVGFILVKIRN